MKNREKLKLLIDKRVRTAVALVREEEGEGGYGASFGLPLRAAKSAEVELDSFIASLNLD